MHRMKKGDSSNKAASSLIVIMLVVVIALAGTAVYVALDKNVFNDGDYVMPGSKITYSIGNVSESKVVWGYNGKEYVMDGDTLSSTGIITYEDAIKGTYKTEDVKVDIPGYGKTNGVTVNTEIYTITFVFNGLPYKISIQGEEDSTIAHSEIKTGTYGKTNAGLKTFASGSNTIELSCVSESMDGKYLFEIKSSGECDYYRSDASGIPSTPAADGTCSIYDYKIHVTNGSIDYITYNGVKYTIKTA